MTVDEIYTDALAELGIKLEITRTQNKSFSGHAEVEGEGGFKIFARVCAKFGATIGSESAVTVQQLKQSVTNLNFITECLKESGRRLVIEDFHYLSKDQRKLFAFEMKALWELEVFVIVTGIWEETNYLLSLNHDLAGRVEEVSIKWKPEELEEILVSGGTALNVLFSKDVIREIIRFSYHSAGILQAIADRALQAAGITEAQEFETAISDITLVAKAAKDQADQFQSVYNSFAKKVTAGIRQRNNSTHIYAYAMEAIMQHDDTELVIGVPVHRIYELAHARQNRINLGNLRNILGKFESIQADDNEQGLILLYSEEDDTVSVVDHQFLLYRHFRKGPWPWDVIISDIEN